MARPIGVGVTLQFGRLVGDGTYHCIDLTGNGEPCHQMILYSQSSFGFDPSVGIGFSKEPMMGGVHSVRVSYKCPDLDRLDNPFHFAVGVARPPCPPPPPTDDEDGSVDGTPILEEFEDLGTPRCWQGDSGQWAELAGTHRNGRYRNWTHNLVLWSVTDFEIKIHHRRGQWFREKVSIPTFCHALAPSVVDEERGEGQGEAGNGINLKEMAEGQGKGGNGINLAPDQKKSWDVTETFLRLDMQDHHKLSVTNRDGVILYDLMKNILVGPYVWVVQIDCDDTGEVTAQIEEVESIEPPPMGIQPTRDSREIRAWYERNGLQPGFSRKCTGK